MKYLLSLLFALCVQYASCDIDFLQWSSAHGKTYKSEEEVFYRHGVFYKNMKEVDRRNSLGRSFKLALNKYADMDHKEFTHNIIHGYNVRKNYFRPHYDVIPNVQLSESVDWVSAGAVTPVKNQGQCGSCWAFSTTGSVEGAWFLSTGSLESFSEQQLVDCSSAQGNQGCNGGMMDQAFQYIIQNGGICTEASYPYQAVDGTCTKCNVVGKINSYVDVQPNNETALMIAVMKQPVSVAVEADGFDWQFYSGGVVTDSCGTNLDHGVLVVGYGTDSSLGDYWKVKNSWGPDWGEGGYIRLGRGSKYAPNGQCGILMDPSYPVV